MIKRLFPVFLTVLLLALASMAQNTGRFYPTSGSADPTGSVNCDPTSTNLVTLIYYRTATNIGWYACTGTNTWTFMGSDAGTGITSLGTPGQTGATQTFADADDTNVTLAVTSATNQHTFTLGWTSTLAKSRQNAATVYNDAANTFSAGLQDFGAVLMKLPSGTGLVGTDCDDAAEAGRIFVDTDATSGRQIYGCEGTAGWMLQGDGGTGGSVTIREADASPSLTATTLQFDQADGFTVTDLGSNVAQVDLVAATASQAGVVSAAAQTFGGAKSFLTSLLAPIFSSNGTDPADAGLLRAQNADNVCWEASPTGTDVCFNVDSNEIFQFVGILNASTLTENALAVPNSSNDLTFFAATTSAGLAGVLNDESGSGPFLLQTSPTIGTPVITGAIAFPDGVRQTFNPDATTPGVNVGAQAGDPSTPSNGDIWYNSTTGLFRCRQGGASTNCIAGGSISGTLTSGVIPVATGGSTLGDSQASDNGTTFTYAGSGGISATQVIMAGSGAGFYGIGQGTAQATVTNTIGLTGPTSITAYNLVFPSSASDGFIAWQNATNIVTGTFRTLQGGAGIAVANGGGAGGDPSVATASTEAGFLADGGAANLTCGTSNQGKTQVMDNGTLQFCDGATTSVLQTLALGSASGQALTGDSATAFFTAGQLEAARGGTNIDSSALTGVVRIAAGTWSTDAGIAHLAASTSANLASVLNDEAGTGLVVFSTAPTLAGPIFTPSTVGGLPAAAGATGRIFVATDSNSPTACSTGSGANVVLCRSDGSSWLPIGDGTTTGSSNFQVNGSGLTSSSTVNFQNSDATIGLTLTFANPSAGNVKLGLTGVLSNAGGGTGGDTSATTGLPRIASGNWTYDAGINHLAASSSADLAGVLSNETGTGLSVFNATPALTTPDIADFTVAGLPAAGTLGRVTIVRDGTTKTDCSTGGGSEYVWCMDNGTAWTSASGTAGGAGMGDPGANGIMVRTALNTSTARSVAAGAGLTGSNLDGVSGNPTLITASGEADFLASGALTCGASAQGKAQVHTTPLQYCDNAATPALQYAAYGDSVGASLSGDSATAFFPGGTIEAARLPAASDTASGISELAIGSEVDTATDATRAITPDALGNSDRFGTFTIPFDIFPPGTAVTTGDGKRYFVIPAALNGTNLVGVAANAWTAGTTNATSIDIDRCAAAATGNVCSSTVADMLSTNITIDSGENSSATAGTAVVIDTANDDVATDQVLRINVDAVSTTAPQGLQIRMVFKLP